MRKDNLNDALLFQLFRRDVEDELSWIDEKRAVAMSTDLGGNLMAVVNLQKQHEVLVKALFSLCCGSKYHWLPLCNRCILLLCNACVPVRCK